MGRRLGQRGRLGLASGLAEVQSEFEVRVWPEAMMGVPPASLRASATCVARAAGPESRGRHAQDRPGPSAAAKLAQVCLAAALATARRSRSLARRTAAARHVSAARAIHGALVSLAATLRRAAR